MTSNNRMFGFGSLIAAGLLSLGISFFGCIPLFTHGFQNPHRGAILAPVFLLILEFPLFAMGVGISKRFSLALWAMAVLQPLAMLITEISLHGYGYALVLRPIAVFLLSLTTVAALVQIGTRCYLLPLDKRWTRRPRSRAR